MKQYDAANNNDLFFEWKFQPVAQKTKKQIKKDKYIYNSPSNQVQIRHYSLNYLVNLELISNCAKVCV